MYKEHRLPGLLAAFFFPLCFLCSIGTVMHAQVLTFDWWTTSNGTPLFMSSSDQGFFANFATVSQDSSKTVHFDDQGAVLWARDYPFQPMNLASGNGGLFGISHIDTNHIEFARLDPNTGIVQARRFLNTSAVTGYAFNAWDYLRTFATADSGLLVVPSEYMCGALGMGPTCAIKLNRDLDVVHAGGYGGVGNLNQFDIGIGTLRNNGDILLGNYCRNQFSNGAQSGMLVQLDGATGALENRRYLHYNSNWVNMHVEDLVEFPDRVVVLMEAELPPAQGGGRKSILLALSPTLDQTYWAKVQNNCTVTKIARGADGRLYGTAEGSVNFFCMNMDGSIHWAKAIPGHSAVYCIPAGVERMAYLSYASAGTFVQQLYLSDTTQPGPCMGNAVTMTMSAAGITNMPVTAGGLSGSASSLPPSAPGAAILGGFSHTQVCASACLADAYFSYTGAFLNVTFAIGGSTGTHQWTFGDGNSTSTASPSHTYAAAGTYTVCHIVSTSCGNDTVCLPVVVCPRPVADFVYNSNSLSLTFGNNSSGNGSLNYSWDFGDGSSSTLSNPVHAFPGTGTYTVCLIARNSCNADTVCEVIQVTCAPTISAFSIQSNLYTANFSNSSSGYGTLSYAWDFGDGTFSTQASPTHVYPATGSYQVCLITTGICSSDTTCQLVIITCPPTQANWTSTTSFLTSTFANLSSGGGNVSMNWFFGDGATSNAVSPVHTYPAAGSYQVCMVASGICGVDTFCGTITATCPADPVAGFSMSSSLLQATFTNLSTTGGANAVYHWDFGDGGTSTALSPTYSYLAPGNYTVCLVVDGICASDSICQTISIVCPAPLAQFTATATLLDVIFANASQISGTANYLWDFGDGSTSVASNPMHHYAAEGAYLACLTVTDACGTHSICDSIHLTCPALQAGFAYSGGFQAVQFMDQSIGAPITWLWDFGDGQTSSLPSPMHAYAQAGTYFVCLTVDDSCREMQACQNVQVAVGIEAQSGGIRLELYPQPASDWMVLELDLEKGGAASFRMVDMLGRMVASGQKPTSRKHRFAIEVSSLPGGIYGLEMLVGNQVIRRSVVLSR